MQETRRASDPLTPPSDPELASMAEALAQLPEAERPAILAHLRALASMSAHRRAAVLTLTSSDA